MSGQPKGTRPNPRRKFRPLLAVREEFLRQLAAQNVPGARSELNMYESWRRSFAPLPAKEEEPQDPVTRLLEEAA